MAILLDFEKVREDDQEVEYAFGYPEKLDRRLVIEKESQEGRLMVGPEDQTFSRVYWKILKGLEKLGHWPSKGSYAA